MSESIGDIQLNINVNVRNAASLGALNSGVANLGKTNTTTAGAISAASKAFIAQAKSAQTVTQRLNAAEKEYDAIFRASYRLQNVGYGLVSVSQRIFGALKDLTDQWGTFEFMVNRAAGALQIWKMAGTQVNPVYTALIDQVEGLTKDLRLFPATDVAQATYFWASTSGQAVNTLSDLKSVLESVNPLMKIAALTQTSYESAIKGVYSILVQYHKPLADVADVTNKLFLVTQRTALEFPDLVNAFKFIGPVAGALGVSFEEVAQTLGELGDAGIRGTIAGRALRQVFIQLERPTQKAAGLLNSLFLNSKAFGKTFQQVVFPNGKFIGLTNTVTALATALQHVNQAQRINFLASITTANEFSVIVPLVENQIKVLNGAADAYDTTKTSVENSANAALQFSKAWDLLSQSWLGIVGRLKAGAEVIRLQIGQQIAAGLQKTVDQASKFLDFIEKWVRSNPQIVSTIGSFAAGLAGLAAVAGGLFILSGSLLGLYAAIGVLSKGFGPLIGVGGAALGAIASIAESIVRNWTMIQRTVIPAINGLIAALTNGNGTTAEAKKQWDDLHQTIRDVTDFIVRNVIRALTDVLHLATDIANSPLRGVFESLGQAIFLLFGLKSLSGILGFTGALKAMVIPAKEIAVVFGAVGPQIGFVAKAILSVRLGFFNLITTLAQTTAGFKNWMIVLAALIPLLAGIAAFAHGANITAILGIAAAATAIFTAIMLWKNTTGVISLVKTGIMGLAGSFKALALSSPLLIITGLALAFQFLVDQNILGIGDAINRLTHSLQDIKDEIDDIRFETGKSAPAITTAIDKVVETTGGWSEKISDAAAGLARVKSTVNSLGVSGPQSINALNTAQTKYNDAVRGQAEATDALWKTFKQDAQDAGTSVTAFGDLVVRLMPIVNNSFETAENAAKEYFTYLGTDGTLSIENAVAYWNKLISEGIAPKISKEDFLRNFVPQSTLDQAGRDIAAQIDIVQARSALSAGKNNVALGILLSLKAQSSQYGPQIQKTVEDLLSGMPKGVQDIIDATETLANQAPGGILTALEKGFTSLGDIGASLKSALKRSKALTPANLVKQLFGDPLKSLSAGFLSTQWGMADWATAQLADVQTTFNTAVFAAQQSGNTSVLAKAIIAQYTGPAFTQQFGKNGQKLPAELRSAVQGWVNWAYGELGTTPPSPSTNAKVTSEVAKKLPKWLQYEWSNAKPDTTDSKSAAQLAIEQATIGMRDAWTQKGGGHDFLADTHSEVVGAFTYSLYGSGGKVIGSWIDGAEAVWATRGANVFGVPLRTIARYMIGQSPPPDGPLKNIDKGGENIMKAWAGGVQKGARLAVVHAANAADAVQNAINLRGEGGINSTLSFEHNNTRVIKVQVDVTSKDGAIDGLNMKVLGDSIKPDLIRELEHIAAST